MQPGHVMGLLSFSFHHNGCIASSSTILAFMILFFSGFKVAHCDNLPTSFSSSLRVIERHARGAWNTSIFP
ncbi:hypothetical protein R3P38DRAFT_3048357 [Favolaschia claudopus]|uniref:Secreted protein n=1 Tax=Favolaschia claudopus TaxID=2862362 RepID=A0AAW0A5F1_9AGAR